MEQQEKTPCIETKCSKPLGEQAADMRDITEKTCHGGNMNWIEQNVRDEKMLSRLNIELLNQEIVAHGDELARLVGEHNSKLVALAERFGQIVADRTRMVDVKVWADRDVDVVLAERARLAAEHWSWLQAVRAVLVQRHTVLSVAEKAIDALMAGVDRRREATVARLNKSMAKIRREYVNANPLRGECHFSDLVNADDAVVVIDQQHARLKPDFEWVVDRRRRAGCDQSAVLMRQEEVFKALLN